MSFPPNTTLLHNSQSYSPHSSLAILQEESPSALPASTHPPGQIKYFNFDVQIVFETQRFLGFLEDYMKDAHDNLANHPANFQLQDATFLHSSLLRISDNPTNKEVNKFTCTDISRIIEIISRRPIFTDQEPSFRDNPVKSLWDSQNRILQLGRDAADKKFKLSAPQFGRRHAWHKMQDSPAAILCHRPASNRPHLPLELMHEAFYEFMKEPEFLDHGERMSFCKTAAELAKQLAAPLKDQKTRCTNVFNVLKRIFPDKYPFKWFRFQYKSDGDVGLIYSKILSEDCLRRFDGEKKKPAGTNLMIFEIKLETGENGDAFMQVCRSYDVIIKGHTRYRETGAPTFLITMAGMSLICFSLRPLDISPL